MSIHIGNSHAAVVVLAGTPATVPADHVSVVTDRRGWEYRAVTIGTTVRAERRTLSPDGAWTLMGSRAGAEASIAVDLYGRPHVDYNDTGTIRRWMVEGNSVATIGTGSNPRTAWNRGRSLECRTRWRAGSLYAEVLDQQGNSVSGEVEVAAVDECAGDVDWHLDGRPYIHYPDGGSVVEVTSPDNGATWA